MLGPNLEKPDLTTEGGRATVLHRGAMAGADDRTRNVWGESGSPFGSLDAVWMTAPQGQTPSRANSQSGEADGGRGALAGAPQGGSDGDAFGDASPSRLPRVAKLLIVDDEPQIGNTLRLLLQPECEVSPMTSARAALARLARGEKFDVIFCDLMMPDMSGMQFHAELREFSPEQADAVVFMTGGAYLESSREFLEQMSSRCIDKPFDFAQLRALIASRVR